MFPLLIRILNSVQTPTPFVRNGVVLHPAWALGYFVSPGKQPEDVFRMLLKNGIIVYLFFAISSERLIFCWKVWKTRLIGPGLWSAVFFHEYLGLTLRSLWILSVKTVFWYWNMQSFYHVGIRKPYYTTVFLIVVGT